MVNAVFHHNFEKVFSKIKEKSFRERVIKQLEKIKQNPEVGKPMRFTRKGTREVYISHFRLSYIYFKNENKIVFLDIYHKDEQ